MSPVDAIMPTTAALHRHLARASASPVRGSKFEVQGSTVPQPSTSSEPRIAKYIIVRDDFATTHSRERVILFSQELQHNCMVPLKCTPVSAGFAMIFGDQVTIPMNIHSETLKLGPRPQDQQLIASLLNQ